MIITAKFAAVCPCCSGRINAGDKIEWSKGSKAKHVSCADKPATMSTPRASAYRGASYERGIGMVCDDCGERAIKGTRCWETGAAH